MTQRADFCGDRLRLSAFLRVVADGMPQRPTRFKRRLEGLDHSFESAIQRDPALVDLKSSSNRAPVFEQGPDNTGLDVVRLPSSHPPEIATEDSQSANQINSEPRNDCGQSKDVQAPVQRQTGGRLPTAATIKPSQKPRKISSTRKRRHLPVNELALLRTTSSDGLSLPSDADRISAITVATLDPIEDSQIRSATPLENPAGRPRIHCVEKLSPVSGLEPGSTLLLLRERFAPLHLPKTKGPQSRMSSRHKSATGSDGFVGTELSLQHSTKWNKPRASNRSQTKKSVCNKGGLTLASGYLPAPLVEHQHDILVRADPRLRTAGLQANGTAAFAEFVRTTTRERRRSQTQGHDDLVRRQLSTVTAPSRRPCEGSGGADDADEVTRSHRSSLELVDGLGRIDPQWLHTSSTGRAYDRSGVERYFERAMCDLYTAGLSDGVNGEFWTQYGGLERSDGSWDARGATSLVHYI